LENASSKPNRRINKKRVRPFWLHPFFVFRLRSGAMSLSVRILFGKDANLIAATDNDISGRVSWLPPARSSPHALQNQDCAWLTICFICRH
jgi:hypothetical protein